MNEPKAAYSNKHMLFSLPVCFDVSNSTAKPFVFKSRTLPPPKKKSGEGDALLLLPRAPKTLVTPLRPSVRPSVSVAYREKAKVARILISA